jgi:hypothetical protein
MLPGVLECYFCGTSSIKTPENLLDHMLKEHSRDPTPYSCHKCRDFSAPNKSRLSIHIKKCEIEASPVQAAPSKPPLDLSWQPRVQQSRPSTKRRRKNPQVSDEDDSMADLGETSEEQEADVSAEDDYNEMTSHSSTNNFRKKSGVITYQSKEQFLAQFTPGGKLNRQLQCPTCLYCYDREQGLESHRMHHDQDLRLECYFCSQLFPVANHSELLEHMVSLHFNQEHPFSCSLCGTKMTTKAAQIRHFSRHKNKSTE